MLTRNVPTGHRFPNLLSMLTRNMPTGHRCPNLLLMLTRNMPTGHRCPKPIHGVSNILVFLLLFVQCSPFGVWYRDAALFYYETAIFQAQHRRLRISFVWVGDIEHPINILRSESGGRAPAGRTPGSGVQQPIRWISTPHEMHAERMQTNKYTCKVEDNTY